jgi:hypothetical protein
MAESQHPDDDDGVAAADDHVVRPPSDPPAAKRRFAGPSADASADIEERASGREHDRAAGRPPADAPPS